MDLKQEPAAIKYEAIGLFHTRFTPQGGSPRQARLAMEEKAILEIFPPYQPALESLDIFEYLIVLYHLHGVTDWDPRVRPLASRSDRHFGLFATRTPRRPNPIGMAVAKLEKIEKGHLHISGVDAWEGTPILDIKPYLPTIDRVPGPVNRAGEKELGLPGFLNENSSGNT